VDRRSRPESGPVDDTTPSLDALLPLDRRRATPAPAPVPVHEPAAVPPWRRILAAALDAALVSAVAVFPILVAARALPHVAGRLQALFPACAAFVALLGFTYAALGHGLMGATIGKRLLGLRVTGPDGAAPGMARSAVRAAVAVAGTAALGVGVVVGLCTRGGRSLHDRAAGTSVVRVP